MCCCEPIAYEIFIPAPSREEFLEWQIDPDWGEVLPDLTGALSRELPIFKYRGRSRPYNQSLRVLSSQTPQLLLEQWASFYATLLHATGCSSLDKAGSQDRDNPFIFVIELGRRLDELSQKSIAFCYRVVSCDKIRWADTSSWLRTRSRSVERSTLHAILGDLKEVRRTFEELSNSFLHPGKAPLPMLVVVPGDDSGPTQWITIKETTMMVAENSWFIKVPPKDLLDGFIDHGFWVGRGHLDTESPPLYRCNAWGFFYALRDLG